MPPKKKPPCQRSKTMSELFNEGLLKLVTYLDTKFPRDELILALKLRIHLDTMMKTGALMDLFAQSATEHADHLLSKNEAYFIELGRDSNVHLEHRWAQLTTEEQDWVWSMIHMLYHIAKTQ